MIKKHFFCISNLYSFYKCSKGSAAYSSIDALENGDVIILFERDNYSKISLTKLSLKSLPKLF